MSELVLKAPEALVEINEEKAKKSVIIKTEEEKQLEEKAEIFVNDLFKYDLTNKNPNIMAEKIASIQNLGVEEMQKTASLSNDLLQISMKQMEESGDSNQKNIAGDLVKLQQEMNKLDPKSNNIDFSKSGIAKKGKLFGIIPMPFGNQIEKYFLKYQSSEESINAILNSLANGKNLLEKNNINLENEKVKAWDNMHKLKQYSYLTNAIISNIENNLNNSNISNETKKIIEEEALYTLNQKLTDLNTQIAVAVNGYVAYDQIIKNNKELITGVTRCQTTTVSAMKYAITMAKALYDQQIVLKSVQGVQDITEKFILATSEMHKNQSTEIYKQATSATIKPEVLQQSFDNLNQAFEAINNYKAQAITNLKKDNEMLSNLNKKSINMTDRIRNQKVSKFLIENNIQEKDVSSNKMLSLDK